jgi:hypothetical protein
MPHPIQREISWGNDCSFPVGPITANGGTIEWPGTEFEAFIVRDKTSDTPLGAVTLTVPITPGEAGVVSFEAAQVDTILTDAETTDPLYDKSVLWCILKADNDFRRAVKLLYRAALIAP